MKKLLVLVAGGIGYVLGTRAGRERYEQIKGMATKVKDDPRVQDAAHQAADTAKAQAPVVKDKVTSAASAAAEKVKPVGQQHDSDLEAQLNPDNVGPAGQPLPPGRPALSCVEPTRVACRDTALASVSDATWSTTTRRRAASSAAAAQSSANGPVERVGPALPQRREQLGEQQPLALHQRHPVGGLHDVVGGDPLEDPDLHPRLLRAPPARPGGGPAGPSAAANVAAWTLPQNRPIRSLVRFLIAAQVAPASRRTPSSGQLAWPPHRRRAPSASSSSVDSGQVPRADGLPERVEVEPGQVEPTGHDAVLHVVHGVGHVVGEVHHLRLDALAASGDALAQPVEDRERRRRTPRT